MSIDTYTIVAAGVFGLCFGSFLNVLIYRLPRGKSVVWSRSTCTKCKAQIAWYDNVPVLSYLLLGGKCRRCDKRISALYPAVELASGVAAALIVYKYGLTLKAVWVYAFISIMLVITFIDWFHKIIPDVLSLGGVLLGWAGSFVCLDVRPLESLVGSLIGGGIIIK